MYSSYLVKHSVDEFQVPFLLEDNNCSGHNAFAYQHSSSGHYFYFRDHLSSTEESVEPCRKRPKISIMPENQGLLLKKWEMHL